MDISTRSLCKFVCFRHGRNSPFYLLFSCSYFIHNTCLTSFHFLGFNEFVFHALYCSHQLQKMVTMIILGVEILQGVPQKGIRFVCWSIYIMLESSLHKYLQDQLDCFSFHLLFCKLISVLILIFSLLAKLDKGDRAFCFTSGMAALTAVTHLVGTGAFHSFCCLFFPYTTSILSTMPHYYLCFKISPACYGLEICNWL